MIFTNLGPNVSLRDVRILSSFFFLPWKWRTWYNGSAQTKVKAWFQQYLGTEHVYLLDSGRSALLLALQSLDLKPEDEVIVPGYTCIVVINAIRAVGAVPVLVDIGEDLNMSVDRTIAAITDRTKVIIAQHTFGLPCDLSALRACSNERKIILIEDCAHALGAHIHEQPVGTVGDMAFFSFGSDKIVSSVRGGALAVKHTAFTEQIKERYTSLPHMPNRTLWQHILYISSFPKLKPWYRYGGKGILYLLRKYHITAAIFDSNEKTGEVPSWTPAKYPNILAAHIYPQLRTLYTMKITRRIIAGYYRKQLPKHLLLSSYQEKSERTYLHFPILIEQVEPYARYMKQHGVQVGTDWNGTPVAPKTATQQDVHSADISTAITISKEIVQLPIHQHMSIRKAKKVVDLTKRYMEETLSSSV